MNQLSPFELILNASLIVQLVMLLLLFMSILSWSLILRKSRGLNKAQRVAELFENHFLQSKDYNALYNRITNGRRLPVGLENIFSTGFREFVKLRKQQGIAPWEIVEGVERVMQAALQREEDKLDTDLTTLATIGSVSPYIGLFGTVWGIMHSFHGLSGMQQVTLAMVAPGISEALIATAMGLFAAIPAVIAYNSYTNHVEHLLTRYETFLKEFTSTLQRQAYLMMTAQSNAKIAECVETRK